jgi:FkbM family methyltransferase
MKDYIVSYAQNYEDIIINGFFPDIKKGKYIDVGAYDPEIDSVTKFFYDRGWSGINIEPQPKLIKKFISKRKRDTNLNVGISNKKDKLKLREFKGDGLSTFSENTKEEYEKHPDTNTLDYTDYDVQVTTLKDVFSQYYPDTDVQFLKIDVEGYELEVISGNDWERYRPHLLCIESNHIYKDWKHILQEAGYSKVFNDGLNDYYLSKEQLFRKEYFSYPEEMFMKGNIIKRNVEGMLLSKDAYITKLETNLNQTEKYLHESKQYALKLENELEEYKRRHHSIRYHSQALTSLAKQRLKKGGKDSESK